MGTGVEITSLDVKMDVERPLKVMLADSQPISLDGTCSLIQTADDLTLVGTAKTLAEAVKKAAEISHDVIVLNTSLPDMDGFSVVQQFASAKPCRGVVLLSEIEDRPYVERALQAGVNAYVLKRSDRDCLLHGIRAAGSGGVYLDPAIAANFLATIKRSGASRGSGELQLAPREAEVIRLIALGHSIKEIAAQLDVTAKSVETYKARACEKLELTTRAHIVRFAAANGWLPNL
jgi:DNA-binding NarL/FixJ family response regulator